MGTLFCDLVMKFRKIFAFLPGNANVVNERKSSSGNVRPKRKLSLWGRQTNNDKSTSSTQSYKLRRQKSAPVVSNGCEATSHDKVTTSNRGYINRGAEVCQRTDMNKHPITFNDFEELYKNHGEVFHCIYKSFDGQLSRL